MKNYFKILKNKTLDYFTSEYISHLKYTIENLKKDNQEIKVWKDKYYHKKAMVNIAYERANDLQNSILEYVNQLEDTEDKLLKLNCKMSKDMFEIENEILKYNNQYVSKMDKSLRQGEEYTTSQSISFVVEEHGIYCLFHKYNIEDINNYLKKIYDYKKNNQIILLTYLYLHNEKLKYENSSNSEYLNNWSTKDQVKKIKNIKCEG